MKLWLLERRPGKLTKEPVKANNKLRVVFVLNLKVK